MYRPRIRELRKRKGLSQNELAQRTGLSPSYLSMMETGQRELSPSCARKISRALEVSPAALAHGADGTEANPTSFMLTMLTIAEEVPAQERAQLMSFGEFLLHRARGRQRAAEGKTGG